MMIWTLLIFYLLFVIVQLKAKKADNETKWGIISTLFLDSVKQTIGKSQNGVLL